MKKRTKIVATISSLNCNEELIRQLYENGMDVARLNTAHMSPAEAKEIVDQIRQVSDSIAIMLDTKGPNIRICNLGEPLTVSAGQTLTVSSVPIPPGEGIQVNYARFCTEVKAGQHIIVDDGIAEMEIRTLSANQLTCTVIRGGEIKDRKSVNVPNADLRMPALSKRDREFIDFAIENDIDFIAHSFVRDRDDIMALQSILDTSDSKIKIIAKIENRQGVQNLSSILDLSYGIMVARGDLGIEIPLEEVPMIQKHIIYECMKRHKPVITATQMLQTMETAPRPTRAEVSDIANAVMDGTDAVMLSGETANGKYPVESVAMMASIIRETERSPSHLFIKAEQNSSGDAVRDHIVYAAVELAQKLSLHGLICNTKSGNSCNMCSAFRGSVPIFGITYDATLARQLALSYGVYPVLMEYVEDPFQLKMTSIQKLFELKLITPNDLVVLIGQMANSSLPTNLCAVVKLGDILTE